MWRLCNSAVVMLATEKTHGMSNLSEKGDVLILYSSFLINMHLFPCEGLLFTEMTSICLPFPYRTMGDLVGSCLFDHALARLDSTP